MSVSETVVPIETGDTGGAVFFEQVASSNLVTVQLSLN